MYEIANQFTDPERKKKYVETVLRFRLPYWDPWMPRNVADPVRNWSGMFAFPTILRAQEVFVKRPSKPNEFERIDNPLYRYKMPDQGLLGADAKIHFDKDGIIKRGIVSRNDDITRMNAKQP